MGLPGAVCARSIASCASTTLQQRTVSTVQNWLGLHCRHSVMDASHQL